MFNATVILSLCLMFGWGTWTPGNPYLDAEKQNMSTNANDNSRNSRP